MASITTTSLPTIPNLSKIQNQHDTEQEGVEDEGKQQQNASRALNYSQAVTAEEEEKEKEGIPKSKQPEKENDSSSSSSSSSSCCCECLSTFCSENRHALVFKKYLSAFYIPNLSVGIATAIVSTLIPVTLKEQGESASVIGMVCALVGLGRLLADLPTTFFTQKFGPLMVICVSLFLSAVCYSLPLTDHFKLWTFAVCQGVGGIPLASFATARLELMQFGVEKAKRNILSNHMGAGARAAYLFGPLLGGFLYTHAGSYAGYGSALGFFAIALISTLCSSEIKEINTGIGEALKKIQAKKKREERIKKKKEEREERKRKKREELGEGENVLASSSSDEEEDEEEEEDANERVKRRRASFVSNCTSITSYGTPNHTHVNRNYRSGDLEGEEEGENDDEKEDEEQEEAVSSPSQILSVPKILLPTTPGSSIAVIAGERYSSYQDFHNNNNNKEEEGEKAPLLLNRATSVEKAEQQKQEEEGEERKKKEEEPDGIFATICFHRKMVLELGFLAFSTTAMRQARRLSLQFRALDLGYNAKQVGEVLALSFTLDALLFFIASNVINRYGFRAAITPLCIGYALSFLTLSFNQSSESNATLLCSAVMFGISDSLGAGTLLALVINLCPRKLIGTLRFFVDLGVAGGFLLTGVFVHLGFQFAMLVFMSWAFVTALWAWIVIPPEAGIDLSDPANRYKIRK